MAGEATGADTWTLAGPGTGVVLARRSRFHAYAAPTPDRDGLERLLRRVRAEYPNARHIPFAWVDAAGTERSADQGEPPGTAGRPCLDALRRHRLRAAGVAVARLFGGVLLGAGNLGRAYGEAAAAAVSAAGRLRWETLDRLRLAVPHADLDRAERAIARAGGRVAARAYEGDRALLDVVVPAGAAPDLRERWPEGAG